MNKFDISIQEALNKIVSSIVKEENLTPAQAQVLLEIVQVNKSSHTKNISKEINKSRNTVHSLTQKIRKALKSHSTSDLIKKCLINLQKEFKIIEK